MVANFEVDRDLKGNLIVQAAALISLNKPILAVFISVKNVYFVKQTVFHMNPLVHMEDQATPKYFKLKLGQVIIICVCWENTTSPLATVRNNCSYV